MKKTAQMMMSIATMMTRRKKIMLDFKSETDFLRYSSSLGST